MEVINPAAHEARFFRELLVVVVVNVGINARRTIDTLQMHVTRREAVCSAVQGEGEGEGEAELETETETERDHHHHQLSEDACRPWSLVD